MHPPCFFRSNRLVHYLVCSLFSCGLFTCGPAPENDGLGQGELITLTRDSLSLTVDPNYGGRLISVKYGERELLSTVRDSMGFRYGSTAWASPQADWGWPPPAALDRDPYTVQQVEAHSVLLKGKETEDGLVLQKRYRLGPDSDIGLTYWLTYNGDTVRSVAAWEVTRLPYRGRIEFYADSVRSERTENLLTSRDSFHTIYFDERHTAPGKVFATLDSVPARYFVDDLVLEKHTVVTELHRVAPGQAPLEIYVDPPKQFAEFELQGDYRELRYGETATLRTKWRVTSLQ